MNCLYFSPRQFWPLETGARLRDYHLSFQLASRCSLTYVGLRDQGTPPPPTPPHPQPFVAILSWEKEKAYSPAKIAKGLWGPTPLPLLNYWSPAIQSRLIDFVRSGYFDSIQIEGVHLLTYLPALRAAAPQARIISDWHNIESEILRRYSETNPNPLRRLAALRTAQLLEAEELRLLRQCDAHCVASDRERERLLALAPGANITTIPNGVDFEFFRPREGALDPTSRRDILFVGSMDYHANIDAALWLLDEIWPQMRTRLPGYRLLIVGRNPSSALRSRASEECIITGTVDDVRPYYDSAAAVVTPLRVGSGTRLKILEAMAAGVPVVSTSLGAEGIAATPDRDILIADTPVDLTKATERVVTTPAIWKQLSAAGMALVRDQYGWPSLGQRLFAVHQQLAGAGHGK